MNSIIYLETLTQKKKTAFFYIRFGDYLNTLLLWIKKKYKTIIEYQLSNTAKGFLTNIPLILTQI